MSREEDEICKYYKLFYIEIVSRTRYNEGTESEEQEARQEKLPLLQSSKSLKCLCNNILLLSKVSFI
jgi:hypothetical protein